jgi:hypothetical protein
MADHRALGGLGWAFGAVTAAVLAIAAIVVTTQADEAPNADTARFVAAATPVSGTHDFANLFHR